MAWYVYLIIFCVVVGELVIILMLRKEVSDLVQLYLDEEKERKVVSNSLRKKGLECEALKKELKKARS